MLSSVALHVFYFAHFYSIQIGFSLFFGLFKTVDNRLTNVLYKNSPISDVLNGSFS